MKIRTYHAVALAVLVGFATLLTIILTAPGSKGTTTACAMRYNDAAKLGTSCVIDKRTPTAKPVAVPTHHRKIRTKPAPHVWNRNQLPILLHLWANKYHGYIAYWGRYDGHAACWAAVADTSLIMCPDGYRTTS